MDAADARMFCAKPSRCIAMRARPSATAIRPSGCAVCLIQTWDVIRVRKQPIVGCIVVIRPRPRQQRPPEWEDLDVKDFIDGGIELDQTEDLTGIQIYCGHPA